MNPDMNEPRRRLGIEDTTACYGRLNDRDHRGKGTQAGMRMNQQKTRAVR